MSPLRYRNTSFASRVLGELYQNVPSIARVAAGAFGFLTLIQVFDGSLIFVTEPVSDCNVGAQSQTDEEEH